MEKHTSTQETVRGQNVFEWYEALISAALVLVLVFSLFFRIIQVDGESMVSGLRSLMETPIICTLRFCIK